MPAPILGMKTTARGALCGLGAAALFGLSAPVAKLLLDGVSPVLLAGLLYLGAALGLWTHHFLRPKTAEAGLHRGDLPILAGVVIAGGLLGPVLMMLGLTRVTGLTGSLLLNLEGVFTLLLAVALFGEHLGRHAAAAAVCILGGAAALKLEPGELGADTPGVLLLAGACFAWGLDNNLTQRLSLRDPFAIVRVKTLVAGTVNTALGLTLGGGTFPASSYLGGALLLGSLSYGVSVVLDAYALRFVGAAREAAYFATAPFVGAVVSIALLGNPLRVLDATAMLAMAAGVALLLRERHSHAHAHEPLEHTHLHTHDDDHHTHEHAADDPPVAGAGERHSHPHRHAPLVHDHRHVPDAHHRHGH